MTKKAKPTNVMNDGGIGVYLGKDIIAERESIAEEIKGICEENYIHPYVEELFMEIVKELKEAQK